MLCYIVVVILQICFAAFSAKSVLIKKPDRLLSNQRNSKVITTGEKDRDGDAHRLYILSTKRTFSPEFSVGDRIRLLLPKLELFSKWLASQLPL